MEPKYDFLGNEITVGSFIAAGGAGNAKAEYGMILYLVLGEAKGKLQVLRMNVDYGPSAGTNDKKAICVMSDGKAVAYGRKSTIENTNRYVVVQVPSSVAWFMQAVRDEMPAIAESILTPSQVGTWIHGGALTPWANKK